MTIHSSHPFADPQRDPLRRLRGRLGAAVTLWTAGADPTSPNAAAGLTVTSVMVAGGEPPRVLALLDPDADLTETFVATGSAVMQLLRWRHRDLAEMFAGLAPAPGGAFRHAEFTASTAGPRLVDAGGWVEVRLIAVEEIGWSMLVTADIVDIEIAAEAESHQDALLLHRRGRYSAEGDSISKG